MSADAAGEFVLERTENPHPKMLLSAIARRAAWRDYLAAMCDATGETPEAIEAWMDRMLDEATL